MTDTRISFQICILYPHSNTHLLQQSYSHGSVCGGEHLHDDRDNLLLVLFCREELPYLPQTDMD